MRRGLRLFIARGEPRGARGSETEWRRGGCSRPIRTELGDDRWVPPAGPTGQRASGLLRCASWAAAGPRFEAGLGRRGGRPRRALPLLFFKKQNTVSSIFFLVSKQKPSATKHKINQAKTMQQHECSQTRFYLIFHFIYFCKLFNNSQKFKLSQN